MNQDKLFGIDPGIVNKMYTSVIKNFILLKYGIDPKQEIFLQGKPLEAIKGVDLLVKGSSSKIDSSAVVGTIRMGYGHHRMAYSVYSHLIAKKIKPLLHDLLAIESNEATAIKEIDGLYSQMSRLSSEWGGVTEWAWGQITAQGNIGSLYLSTTLAESYVNMMGQLSKDQPYISTYPLNGQIAVEAGWKNVHQLIPDNYPQYYLLVPGAMNHVQSPASYYKFIEMGIPKENLNIAGHWVSEPIVSNIKTDSEARLKRIKSKQPKRILLAIGGAGAQKNYTLEFLEKLAPKLKNSEIHLFINTGDHKDIYKSILEKIESLDCSYSVIKDWNSLLNFCDTNSLESKEKSSLKQITLFHYENYFDAFLTTDLLIRISDILATKPSELAFFPIPKLFIRRVGDHEAASAFRSMELGEGTTECREVSHAMDMVKLLTEQDSILTRMNECILNNSLDEIYSGSKKVIEFALNR